MAMLRVRVEVTDVPGALAGLTAALASLGVDVASVDVLDVDGRSVVDELLLRLPPGVTARDVRDVLRMAGAADVHSFAETAPTTDPAVAALDVTRAVLAAPGDADAPGQALALIAYADAGAFIDVGEAACFPLAQRALAEGVPAIGPAGPDASPLAVATGWVLWVAPALSEPQRLAVVGRRLDVRFAATEAARLRALTTLLEQVRRVDA